MLKKNSKTFSRLILLVLVCFLLTFAERAEGEQAKLKVIVKRANVRLKPDLNSRVLKVVQEGTVIESEGKEQAWYKISIPADTPGFIISGYIHESVVTVVEDAQKEVQEKKQVEGAGEKARKEGETKKEVPPKIKPVILPIEAPVKKTGFSFRPYVKLGFLVLTPSAADLGYVDAEGGSLDEYLDVRNFNFGGGIQFLVPLGGSERRSKLGVDLGAQSLFTSHFDTGASDLSFIYEDYDDEDEYDFYALGLFEFSPENSPLFLQIGAGAHLVYWIWDHVYTSQYQDASKTESGLEFALGAMAAAGINLPLGERMSLPILVRLDYLLRYGGLLSASVVAGLSF
jgi:hypothetical protein